MTWWKGRTIDITNMYFLNEIIKHQKSNEMEFQLTASLGIACLWFRLCDCADCCAATMLGLVAVSRSFLRLNIKNLKDIDRMLLRFSWQILNLLKKKYIQAENKQTNPTPPPQVLLQTPQDPHSAQLAATAKQRFHFLAYFWRISIQDKTNLRHETVLQGCVSSSGLAHIAVFPP